MKIARCVAYATAFNWVFGAHADFSWELVGGAGEAERQSANSRFESESTMLSATRYFDPVVEQQGPRALAAFLDPASSISLTASREQQTGMLTLPGLLNPSGELEKADYMVGGRYVLPGRKWYAGGRYSVGDIDLPLGPGVIAASTDARAYALLGGKYFGASTTRLELSLGRSRNDAKSTSESCIFFVFCNRRTVRSETTNDEIRVDVRHVGRFRSTAYSVFGGAAQIDSRFGLEVLGAAPLRFPPGTPAPLPAPGGYAGGVAVLAPVEIDPLRAYTVGAEWFPRTSIGVRFDYTRLDGISDDQAFGVGASWFVSRHVGLELALSRDDPEGDFPRTERAAVRVIGRL
jgi:hypothetical protein